MSAQPPAPMPFSRPGAVDLSSLVNKANTPPPPSGKPKGGPGRYVVDVTEASFDAVMRKSTEHVIVVEFHSPRAEGAEALSQALVQLSDEAQGRWLLARVNVDNEMRVAQALGVQAVPMVVGVIQGQLAPLFQGVLPPEQIRQYLDELMNAAVSNGVTGRAEPSVPTVEEDDEDEEDRDPRFAAADEAVDAGDYAKAREEYDKLVQANPNDAEAVAARAAIGLLARLDGVDPDAVLADAAAKPDDLDAQLLAADVELSSNEAEKAFDRLIGLVRTRAGDERNAVRLRLLELFETQPPEDPTLLKARRNLMSALF
ncbi:MAG TPA: tetratricopeptide repeat protein [Candidatus Avipropionibacterium avicola]|uniref:Tetratricopeptide repeat protein n=1 Tax=Candidatus Avipropionibacterium avicola TaxID=2840701 RepID=A0A9D1GX32_9ACTN|nr:tetratricopeptide repeat protein [Candidatus Avipropionibacterium avicola]